MLSPYIETLKNARDLDRNGIRLGEEELRLIQQTLERDPTLPEAVLFETQWSEHCGYVSSRRLLKKFFIDTGLTEGPNVKQSVLEDAALLYLGQKEGENYYIVLAHESHNHPSQITPYQGAA